MRSFVAFIKIIFLSIFCIVSSNFVFAENFRVRKVFIVDIETYLQSEKVITTGINDAISISLPNDKTYIEGIEIKITIPDEVVAWRDSVALSIYENITPSPNTSQIDYTGDRVFVRPLPERHSWNIQIPIIKNTSFKDSPYATKLAIIPDTTSGFIFIRMQPAMKGIPEETINASLKIAIKPILSAKGKLQLNVNYPTNEKLPYILFIDGTNTDISEEGYDLVEGTHDISIISESYRDEVRTARIEKAKTTNITIDLKSIMPTLLITSPDNTVVYLDNIRCNTIGKEFEITEGEHIIRFKMGDYEVIRTLTAQKGKSYTASLEVDLKITAE